MVLRCLCKRQKRPFFCWHSPLCFRSCLFESTVGYRDRGCSSVSGRCPVSRPSWRWCSWTTASLCAWCTARGRKYCSTSWGSSGSSAVGWTPGRCAAASILCSLSLETVWRRTRWSPRCCFEIFGPCKIGLWQTHLFLVQALSEPSPVSLSSKLGFHIWSKFLSSPFLAVLSIFIEFRPRYWLSPAAPMKCSKYDLISASCKKSPSID